jgi:ABC-type polysaccharide/polyol phosphate export permease
LTAAEDLIGGLSKAYLWGRLGWLDVERRYRRALLGPFWTSISLAVYVIVVGAVGAGLWHRDIGEYLPFLISGMVAWLLVSTITTEACGLLVSRPPILPGSRKQASAARTRAYVLQPGGRTY